MSWLNSNDYKRGYEDGFNDAKNNKDKNYNRSGMSLKFVIHGPEAIKSYCEGYDEGYRIGCRKKNK